MTKETGALLTEDKEASAVNEETERRTRVVRICPDAASCLRPVPALAVEMHESWPGASRHPRR